MPYLLESRKALLKEDPTKATEPGDFNYLFTLAYLEEWLKPGNQRYATIHRIKMDAISGPCSEISGNVSSILFKNPEFGIRHISTAKAAAYDEFRRRVVDPYEEYCITKNGDLEEYKQAEMALLNKMDEDSKTYG